MKRVTLTVVAVLLAVPALAQAKTGIEFSSDIQQQQPGEKQTFYAVLVDESGDPPKPAAGVRPLVTFTNEKTGQTIRVRTAATDEEGLGRASVSFPDSGPWTAAITVNGRPFGAADQMGTFELLPAKRSVAPAPSDGGGPPPWLLSLPIAGLAALGIWWLRRRPRELGA